MTFPIVDVSSWPTVGTEPMGGKPKEWRADGDRRLWLFKEVNRRTQSRYGVDDGLLGEHWAEKLVSEFAQSDDAYPRAGTFGDWYTVDAVLHALDGAAGAQSGRQFVSYLWFDHASSLGFNLPDAERYERLTTHDRGRSVAAWVGRSKTPPFYKNGRRLSLVEAAQEASKLSGVRAERFRSAIAGQLDVAKGIVGEVPGAVMSDEAKRFAIEVIKANAARVMP